MGCLSVHLASYLLVCAFLASEQRLDHLNQAQQVPGTTNGDFLRPGFPFVDPAHLHRDLLFCLRIQALDPAVLDAANFDFPDGTRSLLDHHRAESSHSPQSKSWRRNDPRA